MKDGLYFAHYPAQNRDASIEFPFLVLVYNHRPVYLIDRSGVVGSLEPHLRLENYTFGPPVGVGYLIPSKAE